MSNQVGESIPLLQISKGLENMDKQVYYTIVSKTGLCEKDAITKIQRYGFSIEKAKQVLEILENGKELVDKKLFYVEVFTEFPNFPEGTIGLMVPIQKKYYCINLEKKVIELIVLLINKFTPIGVVSDVIGYVSKFGFQIEPEEACIYGYLKSLKGNKNEIIIVELIDYFKNRNDKVCSEENTICKFSEEGVCKLDEVRINQVLDMLQKHNAIKRYSTWIEIEQNI